jgi:hypothetical protein
VARGVVFTVRTRTVKGRVLPLLGGLGCLSKITPEHDSVESALALLVTYVFADHHDATVTTNDLALVADLFDAWLHLHGYSFSVMSLHAVFTA